MVILKSINDIAKMRSAGQHAMEMLHYLKGFVKDGIRTMELELLCEERLKTKKNVKAAFKGYSGFPYCLCVSVNDEVVHGMPGERILRDGDVVSLDFGVVYDGYYGDVAVTCGVGRISKDAERLLSVTEESLLKGIDQAREGNRLHDISAAVQGYVEEAGYSVVRDFVGHGIGRSLHEDPQLPNYGTKGSGIRLKKGLALAIEPMVNVGGYEVFVRDNGWTAATKDGSLSAHFEHTIAITDNGPEILTRI